MLLLALLACEPEEEIKGPTGADIFCDSFEDADEYELGVFNLNGSGKFEVQLIVDSEDPKDPSLIGNAIYTYENPMTGGGELQGQANPLGAFSKPLGAGTWNFRITGPTDCENELEILIEDGVHRKQCVPLYCD